jgi:hypothetical protein
MPQTQALRSLACLLSPMSLSPTLVTLAQYLAGEFDNRDQAIADPAWFVHLKMWQRPVPLFSEDSITIFAEQANVLQLERPYRQRLLRLQDRQEQIHIQYYSFSQPDRYRGAGANPAQFQDLTIAEVELLPRCVLSVARPEGSDRFCSSPLPDTQCCFAYAGEIRQVSLGFEVDSQQFLSYDKGIDAEGKALWGAIMGPYRYTKRQAYAIAA